MRSAEPGDAVGAATLERMAQAPNYNRWMFDRLRRWIGARVIEIGAGIGNMSAFLTDRERIELTDTEPFYLERLRDRFTAHPNIAVSELRLPAVGGERLVGRFDTVICLNVLEHIEDDRSALRSMRRLLEPQRRLVLLVPALRALYGTLDEALGHHRRYEPPDLSATLSEAGFRVRHLEYFNLAGVPGWWFTGRVLRRRLIPTGALGWYDALVPLFRLEALLPWRTGQSLIAVGDAA